MSTYNIIKFPLNLSKIASKEAFRNYCLKPYGHSIKQTSYMKKPQVIDKFVNHEFQLHRTEKQLENNTIIFKLKNLDLSKPEIKQFLTKIYGLPVIKVNTLRTMGKIKVNPFKRRYRLRDWKKAYVILSEPVDPFFQRIEKL